MSASPGTWWRATISLAQLAYVSGAKPNPLQQNGGAMNRGPRHYERGAPTTEPPDLRVFPSARFGTAERT